MWPGKKRHWLALDEFLVISAYHLEIGNIRMCGAIRGRTGDGEWLRVVAHDRGLILQEEEEIAFECRFIGNLLVHFQAGERSNNVSSAALHLSDSHGASPASFAFP